MEFKVYVDNLTPVIYMNASYLSENQKISHILNLYYLLIKYTVDYYVKLKIKHLVITNNLIRMTEDFLHREKEKKK